MTLKASEMLIFPEVGNIEVRRENQSRSEGRENVQTKSSPFPPTLPYTCNCIANRRRRPLRPVRLPGTHQATAYVDPSRCCSYSRLLLMSITIFIVQPNVRRTCYRYARITTTIKRDMFLQPTGPRRSHVAENNIAISEFCRWSTFNHGGKIVFNRFCIFNIIYALKCRDIASTIIIRYK